jgi:arsenate reductase-like glutaredoxin family protein
LAYAAKAEERANERIKESVDAYKEEKEKLDELNDSLKTVSDRIDELNSKDSLSIIEQEELDKLLEEQELLERQLALQQ